MNFFKEYKKQVLGIVAVIVAITAVVSMGKKSNATFVDNTLGFIVTPLQKITSSTFGWFDEKIHYYQEEINLEDENEELRAKIELLEAENKRLSLYEEENKKLSQLLEISQKYAHHDTTGAEITGKDPGNWYYTFTIDKGSKDGIEKDMVLINAGGLVGKITETGRSYSKAQSILDSRSSVSAMSLRTNDLGVIKGDYSLMDKGLCKMEYIDAESEIMEGDEIVTSTLSDIYPAGITIGYVKEIVTDNNGLTKYAIIQPDVDFKHLSTLLVITDKKEEVAED
ncbi:MAG: rod shape-determining protein MreC [Firmicutes bacterium]|nr:rod shape-determining protein MreC [Bacillota bacterium]